MNKHASFFFSVVFPPPFLSFAHNCLHSKTLELKDAAARLTVNCIGVTDDVTFALIGTVASGFYVLHDLDVAVGADVDLFVSPLRVQSLVTIVRFDALLL
jgi:hypothetical protein